MAILSQKGLLAIAVVVDVALQKDGRISSEMLATRHGLPARHLESMLQKDVAVPLGTSV
jgi:DNA-binding IscR family transcriptional regulator